MLFHSLLIASLSAAAVAQYTPQLVYQFPSPPNGRYINIENIAVRKTNGQLLLNIATGPSMYQLNPGSSPVLLTTLPGPVDSLTGIAETYPGSDIYAVGAGNFTFGPQVPGGLAGVKGTFGVWTVDLNGPKAVAKQAAAIPEAVALNGATAVPGLKHTILIADSGLGAVWSVNVKTGSYKIAIQDPQFAPNANFSLGINGIHVKGGYLYWTNSALDSFGKVCLGVSKDGHVYAAGAVQKIASTVTADQAFDDFALDHQGNAWVATQPNAITAISPSGAAAIVAGGGQDQTLSSPTATAFGLNGCTLYITTGGQGGSPGMEKSGGVYSISVCDGKKWYA